MDVAKFSFSRLVFILPLLLLFITTFNVSVAADLTDGIMAYYPFNGDANDHSGNNNHGEEYGGIEYAPGVSGESASFDGINDYIRVASNPSLNPADQLSISFWVKVDGITNEWSPIVHKGGPQLTGLANREYAVWLHSNSYFHVTSAGDAAQQNASYNCCAKLNDWTHFVAIIDRQNHRLTTYVDGILRFEGNDPYSTFNNNNRALIIGWSEETYSTYSPFNGQLDELRIYDRALTEDEVRRLYLGSSDDINIIDATHGFGAGSFELGTFVNGGNGGGKDYMWVASGDTTTITGWTVGGPGDGVDWITNPTYGVDSGIYAVDLEHSSNSSIATSIPTVVGKVYELSFSAASVTGYDNTGVVSAGSLVNQPFAPPFCPSFPQTYTPFSFLFTATGSTTTIEFTATGPNAWYGPAIDNVSVIQRDVTPAYGYNLADSYGNSYFLTQSIGFQFSPTLDIDVSALGFFDYLGDGLGESHEIGIFDQTGTLLTSVVVPSGTAASLIGDFRYSSVNPLTLKAGQTYTMAAFLETQADLIGYLDVEDLVVPSATSLGSFPVRFLTPSGSGLSFPTETLGASSEFILAPNFLFAPSTDNGLFVHTVGYWRFEEGSVDAQAFGIDSILDETENGNDGTPNGDAFYRSDVPTDIVPLTGADNLHSLDLDGNGYISIPRSPSLELTDQFTVEFWMKASSQQNDLYFLVVDKSHGFTDSTGWVFQGDGTGRLGFGIGNGGSGAANFAGTLSSMSLLDDTWHHVAGTFDSTDSGQEIKLYIDGMLDATGASGPMATNTRDINIGAAWGGGSYTRFFNGSIDELRISDAVLGASEFLRSSVTPGVFGDSIQTSKSYKFSVKQYTQQSTLIELYNSSNLSRVATLDIINPHPELVLSLQSQDPVTIAPGSIKVLSLQVDTTIEAAGVYEGILLEVAVDDGSTLYSNITVHVTEPGTPELPDLTLSAADIDFTSEKPDDPVTLTATISNQGTAPAENVEVEFYELATFLGSAVIDTITVDGTGTASITIPALSDGDHLIRVLVDPQTTIEEFDETNNEASQIVRPLGDMGPTQGHILVTASLPSRVYTQGLFSLNGRAVYDIMVDGIRYTNYRVKGGAVDVTIKAEDGTEWVYGGIHTNINGSFTKTLVAPAVPGTYRLFMRVSDKTFVGTRELVFTVAKRPPVPPLPPPAPMPTGTGEWNYEDGVWVWTWISLPTGGPVTDSDVWVFSEDIYFSQDYPAANEEITIFAKIRYWATSTALVARDIPVNIYTTYPGEAKELIGQTVIPSLSVDAPEKGSRYVYTNWKNQGEGIYIIEVEIDPSFTEENILNNAATRAILVGQPVSGLGSINGQVKDAWGGVGNVITSVFDSNGQLIGSTVTDDTGFYLLESIPPGAIEVRIDTPDGYQADAEAKFDNVDAHSVTKVYFYLTEYQDTAPPMLSVPDDIIVEATGPYGTVVTYEASAMDAQDGELTPVCAPASGNTFPLGLTFVTCTATNTSGNSASDSFNVTVVDTTPPVLKVPEDFTLETTSPSGAEVTFTASATDTVDGDLTPICTPASGNIFTLGTTSVICTATDATGNSASASFNVAVVRTNRPPILAPIANQVMDEGEQLLLPLSASDPDVGDNLTLSVTAPSFVSLNDNGNGSGTLTLSPDFTQSGFYPITLTVTDQGGLNASRSFTLTVNNINRPPVLAPIGDKAVEEGVLLSFIISASDPDDDRLAFSVDGLPGGAEVIDNGDGTARFSWLPSTGQAGEYPVNFTVTDDGVPSLSDSEAVWIAATVVASCGDLIGDFDGDCDVDLDDVNIILAARNTPAEGADDPHDLDEDGMITANDARQLVLLCTRSRCATE